MKLEGNDPVPCDLLVLATDAKEGTCYIETRELDGESNLKIKMACDST